MFSFRSHKILKEYKHYQCYVQCSLKAYLCAQLSTQSYNIYNGSIIDNTELHMWIHFSTCYVTVMMFVQML